MAEQDELPPAAKTPVEEKPSEGGNHPVYYSEIELENGDQPRLDFKLARPPQPVPAKFSELRKEIEDVERLVRVLFQDDRKRLEKFFLQLHMTADTGLRGPDCSAERGAEDLQEAKDNITDEFPAVRERLWWWNFSILAGALALCGVASGIFYWYSTAGDWFPYPRADSNKWPAVELSAFLIPLGVAIGLFVEFVFRLNDDVPYDKLRAVNPGRWRPLQRAINTIVVAYIFAATLGLGVVTVGVAGITLNDFIQGNPAKPELSIAIGFITGFAFPYVRDLMQQFRPTKQEKQS